MTIREIELDNFRIYKGKTLVSTKNFLVTSRLKIK